MINDYAVELDTIFTAKVDPSSNFWFSLCRYITVIISVNHRYVKQLLFTNYVFVRVVHCAHQFCWTFKFQCSLTIILDHLKLHSNCCIVLTTCYINTYHRFYSSWKKSDQKSYTGRLNNIFCIQNNFLYPI